MTKLKAWQFKVECKKCGDTIWSRYQGEFRQCKCGAIAIDQTQHYTRYIGEKDDFLLEESNKGYEEKKSLRDEEIQNSFERGYN